MPAVTHDLTLDDIAAVQAVMAEATHPRQVLIAAEALSKKVLGHKGCTMFRYIHATEEVERLHSSNLQAYPLGGRKKIAAYPVNQAVLAKGQVYVAKDRDDVAKTYKDFERIFAMGVTSIMNVPVRQGGRNIGALNVFGEAGWFDARAQARGRIVASLMVPALLAWPD